MVQVSISNASSKMDVHKDWMNGWATDIIDVDLRNDLWDEEALSEAICESLIDASRDGVTAMPVAEEIPKEFKSVIANISDDFLRSIGIRWLSPAIAPKLLSKEARAEFSDLSREEMQTILQYQNHVMPERLEIWKSTSDYAIEGAKCLLSWSNTIGSEVSARLKLLFPRLASPTQHEENHRERLFSLFLMNDFELQELSNGER